MKASWVIGMMMAAGVEAHAEGCTVDVYVIPTVVTPAGLVDNALANVTTMFREIGVNLKIRIGVPARGQHDTCGAPIVIQLEANTRYPIGPQAMAYALPYQKSGTRIHVILDRVIPNSRVTS